MATRNTFLCVRPGCRGRAETEYDDRQSFLECLECGYAYGFEPLNPDAADPVEVQSPTIGKHDG